MNEGLLPRSRPTFPRRACSRFIAGIVSVCAICILVGATQFAQAPKEAHPIVGLCILFPAIMLEISEKIHRCYSLAFAAFAALFVSALTGGSQILDFHNIADMIEWSPLVFLFSWNILLKMLSDTGFFNAVFLQALTKAGDDVRRRFLLLLCLASILSMFIDPVTIALLFGGVIYKTANVGTPMNPRFFYVSIVISSTIGSAATLVGGIQSLVLAAKFHLGFDAFLVINAPFVCLVLIPLCSILLYQRVGRSLVFDSQPPQSLEVQNIADLVEENQIEDKQTFYVVSVACGMILVAWLLSPLHQINFAWFPLWAAIALAAYLKPHSIHGYLSSVEWETLLFYAFAFMLFGTLGELGTLRMIGQSAVTGLEWFPEGMRMPLAIMCVLWLSAMISAFGGGITCFFVLVYTLQNCREQGIAGVDVLYLVWPLSIGSTIGSIGSIMGSSANLVCMAVSSRQEGAVSSMQAVSGADFLTIGFPTLIALLFASTIWFLFILPSFASSVDML